MLFARHGQIDLRHRCVRAAAHRFNTGRLAAGAPEGIGLANTRARLAQLYGDRQRLELVEHDGGVQARITLPWSEATP